MITIVSCVYLLWVCLLLLHTGSCQIDVLSDLCSSTKGTIALEDVMRLSEQHNQMMEIEASQIYGPTLQIGIVTHATQNIRDYSALSYALILGYAHNNKYSTKMYTEQSYNNGEPIEDARWAKIKILEEALHPSSGWARDMDYVVWVDADLIFIDLNFRLERVFSENRKANLIASAEHAGSSTLINSGCLAVKNSRWSRKFLRDWWEYADRTLFSDQEQFDLLYERNRNAAFPDPKNFTEKIIILPPDVLNSDPPAMTQQRPHNQVLHLMGEETSYRIKVFREGLSEVCRAFNSRIVGDKLSTSQQLTLTQPNLLQWALDIYSSESETLLKEYEEQVPVPPKSAQNSLREWEVYPQGLSASRRLANSVHHYAHALVHTQEPSSSQDEVIVPRDNYMRAVTLRKKVYQLLRRNLVSWKRRKGTGDRTTFDKIREDWPELLKITSVAGQHLLSVTADDVVSQREKRQVAGEILSMMQEMLQNSHSAQHDAILLMVADIHQQIGVLDLAQSYASSGTASVTSSDSMPDVSNYIRNSDAVALEFVDAALQHFQLALEVTQSIAEKSGRHLLISPLTLTANALASLGQFEQAFQYYEQATSINNNLFGPDHHSNIPLRIDYAISLVHFEECERAEVQLVQLELLLKKNGVPRGDVQYQRTMDYIEKHRVKCAY